MYNFDKITVCADMAGCPNKCKHCWIGVTENKGISVEQFKEIGEAFRKYSNQFEIYSWYREPDFRSDYKNLWELEKHLSTEKNKHFELASFWRLVRDETYVKWLCKQDVKKIQLTLFGDEALTDFYVGRKGAYQEIVKAIDILLENGIVPRIQFFVNQRNLFKLNSIVELCNALNIEQKCKKLGQEFELFVSAGSCDGENEKLYDIRIEPEDLIKIPNYMVEHTLKYTKKHSIKEVFGFDEKYLCSQFLDWKQYTYSSCKNPVFYVDSNFDVYPNMTSTYPWWKIGNIFMDGCATILQRYVEEEFFAAKAIKSTKFEDIIEICGDKNSSKLFEKEDYYYYIWNTYLRKIYENML